MRVPNRMLSVSTRSTEGGVDNSCVCVRMKYGACALRGGLSVTSGNGSGAVVSVGGRSSENPKAGFRRDKFIVWFIPSIMRLA